MAEPEDVTAAALLRSILPQLQDAGARLPELKEACATVLRDLDEAATSADDYMLPLELGAAAAGSPKVQLLAVEGVHKLLERGLFQGLRPDPRHPPACLLDTVLAAVCTSSEDEAVQCAVMDCFLTAVTAARSGVHEKSLMLVVKTCFSIYRDARSPKCQQQAQKTLTQMMNVITQRMELSSSALSNGEADPAQADPAARPSPAVEEAGLTPARAREEWMRSMVYQLVDVVVAPREPGEPNEIGDPPGRYGWCVVCRRSAPHYCRETKDPVRSVECKRINLERLRIASLPDDGNGAGSEAIERAVPAAKSEGRRANPNEGEPEDRRPDDDDQTQNLYQKDLVLVFQSLCTLSMKDLPAKDAPHEAKALRSKRLALELLYTMLSCCGPVFRSSERLVGVLKGSLCFSLIKNAVSPESKIFGLALSIIVMLITQFKDHLKHESGVFIEEIFIHILESGNSSFQHKQKVLQVFKRLCTDAMTALELFLCFDCDVDEKNVFEHMVDCLSKIAQGKYTQAEHAALLQPQQEQELKILALKTLATLMGSVNDWGRRVYEQEHGAEKSLEDEKEEKEEKDDDQDEKFDSRKDSVSASPHAAKASPLEERQRKFILQEGLEKFKMKPKRGVAFFKQHGFCGDSPEDLAAFLVRVPVDKTALGDFLGEPADFNKAVMHSMVDSTNMVGDRLDQGLRKFLALFRLPGEAQKIDRIVEKFAEKFFKDNPDSFRTADCAYVLAFSLIMLNTDLHSTQIKNKMTLEQFISNNRKIDDGEDVPRPTLEELFNAILRERISLGEDDDKRIQVESASANTVKKQELFIKETENMVERSRSIMRHKSGLEKKKSSEKKIAVADGASQLEYVAPLFSVVAWPLLATFSVCLETRDDSAVELSIEGFKHCIRIAARFEMDTERDAWLSSLAKFTYLSSGIKEMKPKNVECIKALLSIGYSEGNCLGSSWYDVLHAISLLDRLQLIGQNSRPDHQLFPEDHKQSTAPTRKSRSGMGMLHPNPQADEVRAQVEQGNAEAISLSIDAAAIDTVLNRSHKLNPTAVVHFVRALCQVSKEEVFGATPRIFALQRLVEVADANMNRIRFVWSRVWRVLADHFVDTATCQNLGIAMFSVDSLRQLAMKFLEKQELTSFHFQVEFLRPFESILTTSGVSTDLKEYIVSILSNMCQSRASNLKSGWKVVLSTLSAAVIAEDCTAARLQTTFQTVARLQADHRDLFVDHFPDAVRCIAACAASKADSELSRECLKLLQKSAALLRELQPADGAAPGEKDAELDKSHPAALWFPIFRAAGSLVSDPREPVRKDALGCLFDTLEYGLGLFDETTWKMVFRAVLFPVFDDVHHQLSAEDEGTERSQAMQMQLLKAIERMVDLYSSHPELAFLLPDVLKQLAACVDQPAEKVARIGFKGLKRLLEQAHESFSSQHWMELSSQLTAQFKQSTPDRLDCGPVKELPFDPDELVTQCVVQLLLIDLCKDLKDLAVPLEAHEPLIDALERSFDFASAFNEKLDHRQHLKALGFMKDMSVCPGLLRQEREALSVCMQSLLSQFAQARDDGLRVGLAARLQKLLARALAHYAAKERSLAELADDASEVVRQELDRQVKGYGPILTDVLLTGLLKLPDGCFADFMRTSFADIASLVGCRDPGVRKPLQSVLVRCAPLLRVTSQDV